MAENKRIPVKWIRDKAKSAYQKQDKCYICGTNMQLELHHLNSITLLLEKWCLGKQYPTETDEQVVAIRDEFIEAHKVELYDEVYTLCNPHHVQLHSIYGKIPPPGSAKRQRNWIEIQKDKVNGTVPTMPAKSLFSDFLN